jgi:hypothetical protein
MTMQFTPFNQPDAAWSAVLNYAMMDPEGIALAPEHRQALMNFLNYDSLTFCIAHTAGWAFARKDDLPVGFLVLGASMAAYCVQIPGGIDDMTPDRAPGIMMALRRDSGETVIPGLPWPAKATDPDPRAEFVKPAPVQAPPA